MKELLRDLVLALDPVLWAAEAIGFQSDPWQAELLRCKEKRVILNTSRQVGKSTTCAVLAVHRALFHPRSEIVIVSPSLRQSGEMFRKVCRLLGDLDTDAPLEQNKTVYTLANGSRILSLPGSEETVRGFSAVDLILLDESSRIADDLFSAVTPMVSTSGGRIMLLSTPAGKRGVFFKMWTEGIGWKKIRVPASECGRIPPDFLEAERLSLGESMYQQEYCCQFIDDLAAVFSMEMIMSCRDDGIKPLFQGAQWTNS